MNDKLRRELEELCKKQLTETPATNSQSFPGQKGLVFATSDPVLAGKILECHRQLKELIPALDKEKIPPIVIAGILMGMLSGTKACIFMNLYESLEVFLDHYFHILACSHLAGGKCEKGHNVEKCNDTKNPCADRQVEYGTWSKELTCDTCPFQEGEEKQK